MKNNKGFTLVELLAVIVILGVIITIVTLNVGNSLDRSKKKTAMLTAKSFVTAVNDYNFINQDEPSEQIKCSSTTATTESINISTLFSKLKESIEGDLPDSGTITLTCETKKVKSASLVIGKFTVTYDSTKTSNRYTVS